MLKSLTFFLNSRGIFKNVDGIQKKKQDLCFVGQGFVFLWGSGAKPLESFGMCFEIEKVLQIPPPIRISKIDEKGGGDL